MRNIKKSGFTLIELIVVITILAILGTIAFMAYQGQTGDARNSKRTSDLKQIGDSIRVKIGEGVPILSFVNENSNYKVSGNVGGEALSTSNYKAGTTNFLILDAKEDNFRDPNGQSYALAVTTKRYGKYEIAATMENQAAPRTAKVTGNYSPRKGDIFSSNKILISNKYNNNKSFSIPTKYAGSFVLGDVTNAGKVQKVTGGVNLTVSGTAGSYLILSKSSEVGGLIKGKKGGVACSFVLEGGECIPYTYN